jgi:diguanylate cyclase (GGDEF)-like protein
MLYLLVAGSLALAYFVLPSTPLTKLFLYNGLGLSAVIATVVGVRRHRPERPLPWYLFAAGQASFLTADVIYYVLADVMHIEAFPSLADPFYQAMYPLVIGGLVLLTRYILPGRDLPSLLDATIIAICGFVLLWVFIMDVYVTDSSLGVLGKAILFGQPTFDVLLLAVAVRLAAVVRTSVPAFGMLAVGVGGLLIADVSYGLTQLTSGYQTGGFIDLAWMCFYASFGVAALHPSMATLHAVPAAVDVRLTRKRLVLLSLATLTVPLVDVLFGRPGLVDQVVTTGAAMALFLLVLARVAGLVRSVEDGQEQLRYEASHDALTGLANRVLFADSVERAMVPQPESSPLVAVLFIDLDDFKNVNDSQGHAAGDALLKIVAERLTSCLRPTDLAARLGGDEFAVLLGDVSATQEAAEVAERIVAALSHPAMIGDREVLVGASVGIGVQARHGEGLAQPDVEDLLRGADVAMYLAKSKGKGRYEFFQQEMYNEMVERLQLKADLNRALELDELHLVYHPSSTCPGG